MSDVLWNINSVSLHGSDRHRLDSVSCSIGAGVTAILGRSGAGKTSLLNLLAGMELPDAGTIEPLFGSSAARLPLYWAPQGGGLWPHLSLRQHLTQVTKDLDLADKLLDGFDLSARQSAFPDELSQGERTRLAVARALAVPAGVLLFDEPLVHLDGERKAAGWQVIRQTIKDSGTHLVLTTHEPETVLREADAVICLAEGRLVWEGPVQQLYYDAPNLIVGRFLGPLNWFDVDDQAQWLSPDDRRDQPMCIRPEQLHLDSTTDPTCVVVASEFMGSHARTTIRPVDDDTTKTVYHRPTEAQEIGARVVLRCLTERRRTEAFHGWN
jgi:iron(III) transport system ATP-binding protein